MPAFVPSRAPSGAPGTALSTALGTGSGTAPGDARFDVAADISPDAPLVPLAPFEAYAADVDRLLGRAPLGAADDAWLVLGHALARAAALPRAERGAVCAAGARAVAASLPEAVDDRVCAGARAAGAAIAAVSRELILGERHEAGGGQAAVAAVQTVVAQQEQAGAFLLAFTTLAAARRALAPALDARGRGLLLAQQGRVARQLGALTTAASLYRRAARIARRAEADDVAAVAFVGAGVLASMRGNYPEAREYYRRALKYATRAGSAVHQRASHHGLLGAACAANDLDTALAHGWAALRGLAEDESDQRAESLLILGEVGRQAREYRAALGACMSVIELTDLPRLRLPALGTAARAAAALGEHRLLAHLEEEVKRGVRRSGQQFENARALLNLAEAFDGVRNDLALQYASRAKALGVSGNFHELVARAERVISGTSPGSDEAPAGPDPILRSARAQAVVRSLEALPAWRRYEGLVA